MNIATLAIMAMAIMAFKPKNGQHVVVDPEGNAISPPPPKQITQGYYTSMTQKRKLKMDTPNSLGTYNNWVINKPLDQLQTIKGQYFVLDKEGSLFVMFSNGRAGGFYTVERFDPMNYTVE